jgi:HAE1 family hydrophobic/amphiphilic exporter-1
MIQATYVGADSQTVEQSVATPIEQQMSGVDNLNYMYSLNAANGQMTMIVDFDVKTDPNTDLILTQMRQTQAASQLLAAVTSFGVNRSEISHGAAHDHRALLAARHLRR